MASLRLLLGMIPSTSKIELAEKSLITEYEKLQAFHGSDLLKRYNDLNDMVNSTAFIQKKKEMESLNYKGSPEYTEEKEYNSMQKARDIVLYFKTISGSNLKRFRDIESTTKVADFEKIEKYIQSSEFREKQNARPVTFKDTDEYRKWVEYKALKADTEVKAFYNEKKGLFSRKKLPAEVKTKTRTILRYEELKAYVSSAAFLEKKKMKPVTFKDSEEYKKFQEYRKLKNSDEIKFYYKFRSSKDYANFLSTDNSIRLARYNELKERVSSEEFRERKNYLLDKKRFEKTQMFKDLAEFEKLKKNGDIVWFFKVKDSDKFDILKSRELTFSDEFEGEMLDSKKWITNYYWGEKLLKGRFSVGSDLQAYTEKENFEVRNSILRIVTKPQKITGRTWSATHGFEPKEFSFSSGMINSGVSFRQKYGIFSAKVRLGNPAAKNSFWMIGNQITPHIDVCRTSLGKVLMDFFPDGNNPVKTSLGAKYAKEFYIYTLEWTPDKIVWKINDTVAFTQTRNVPGEALFVNFSGGVDKPLSGMTTMEIDWIRVYQFK